MNFSTHNVSGQCAAAETAHSVLQTCLGQSKPVYLEKKPLGQLGLFDPEKKRTRERILLLQCGKEKHMGVERKLLTLLRPSKSTLKCGRTEPLATLTML